VLSRIDSVFAFKAARGLDIARVVALENRGPCSNTASPRNGRHRSAILLGAIEAMQKRSDGGVRDIARAIERQVTDGLLERGKKAQELRLHADAPTFASREPASSQWNARLRSSDATAWRRAFPAMLAKETQAAAVPSARVRLYRRTCCCAADRLTFAGIRS